MECPMIEEQKSRHELKSKLKMFYSICESGYSYYINSNINIIQT